MVRPGELPLSAVSFSENMRFRQAGPGCEGFGFMSKSLILASASSRRKALLEQVGLVIEVMPSGIEEVTRKDENPRDHVLRLAREKTEEVADRFCDRWVIGADTVVVIEGQILGKPRTPDEARAMLTCLSGRNHWVWTGYAIAMIETSAFATHALRTRVSVKRLSEGEIDWYIRTGEPLGKAGAYAIQGMGGFMIEEIEGSYTNVVGLPLCQVLGDLCTLGAIELR